MTNQMYCLSLDINYDDIDNCISQIDFFNKIKDKHTQLLKDIIEKYPNIELKFGDFIENINESGYRCKGVYVVNKNKKNELFISCLSFDIDDYGTIPDNFLSFVDFEPGYHFEMKVPNECKSYMHNNYIPIPINFLRKQKWIKKDKQMECYLIYKNKKYLLIRKNRKYHIKYNNKVIYGRIYLKHTNIFDFYGFASKNDLEENDVQKYKDYDRIILI